MKRRFSRILAATAMLAAVWAFGCASTSVLGIHYRVPEPPPHRIQRTVTLAFEDERGSGGFLTPMAKDELEGFTNAFALTVSGPAGGPGDLRGAYELAPLFREVLRARLEGAGIRVVSPGAASDARFTFILREFKLDFGDRKWSSRMAYEAALVRGGAVLSRQTVNGSAERVKIMGKAEAEKLLSELVTDTVNQMDVAGLFKQAGL
jgi:hypothetical protein